MVVLANSANEIDDIGFHLLEPKYKLASPKPGKQRKIVAVDGKILDDYRGHYEMAPGTFIDVQRAEDHLRARLTGQPYADIFPSGESEFFYTIVDAQITFEKDGTGRTVDLTLHQNGADMPAKKISSEIPADAPVKKHEAVKADPRVTTLSPVNMNWRPARCSRSNATAPNSWRKLTGQPFFEVFPEANGDFFYKVVDAQLSFKKDANGKVTSLILHQNGANRPQKGGVRSGCDTPFEKPHFSGRVNFRRAR